MRTQKRFTPTLLERFIRQGRGTGTYQDYIPWHRVGRGDPSSVGRSHLMVWRQRQRELLSDGEMAGLLFSTMLPNLVDIREQHRLALDDGPIELAQYDARLSGRHAPGTLSIAKQLGLKHPSVNGGGRSEMWHMTTDQVLVQRNADGSLELLAVAYKHDRLMLTKRKRELLKIEEAYWHARGVKWILITPEVFEERVGDTLSRSAPWGLGPPVTPSAISISVATVTSPHRMSLTKTLNVVADQLGAMDLAQRAFWQAVWSGAIPMDLTTGWRPHLPIRLLDHAAFVDLNPVASRRSAWI